MPKISKENFALFWNSKEFLCCLIVFKITAMQMSAFCLVMDLPRDKYFTNGATLSSFIIDLHNMGTEEDKENK